MGWIGQASSLVVKELRVLLRDRQTLLLLFLMPAVFILFLSLALTNVYNDKVGGMLPVVIDVRDDGEYAARVRSILEGRDDLRLVAAEAGEARARITIPDGFSAEMESFIDGEGDVPFERNPIRWEADPTLDASYRWFLEASLALASMEAILDGLVEEQDSFVPPTEREAAERKARRRFVAQAPGAAAGRVIPTPLQQAVPGWSLFAMFFIVVPLSGSLMRDRQDGTLRRLMTYPVPRPVIVAGKFLPYVFVNMLQFAVMLLVGKFVVPLFGDQSLQLGQRPGQLLLITVVAALAATGYGILVASLARTPEQAGAFGGTSVIVMAVVGGIMVPQFVMPELMQKIAYLSPLYWGLQSYLDVFLREASTATLLPKLGVLLAFATTCFAIAAARLRRS